MATIERLGGIQSREEQREALEAAVRAFTNPQNMEQHMLRAIWQAPVYDPEHTRIAVADGRVVLDFIPSKDAGARWTPEGLRAHMVDWVMATGPRYLERRPEIKTRRKPFRDMDLEWLDPPAGEQL